MLYVEDSGVIRLTRGDTARLTVAITDTNGDAYNLQDGDILTLTVKKKVTESSPLFAITNIGSTVFHIKPEDTSSASYGSYLYDVQLTTSDGDVYTIITPTTFEILSEVTWA